MNITSLFAGAELHCFPKCFNEKLQSIILKGNFGLKPEIDFQSRISGVTKLFNSFSKDHELLLNR